MKYHTVRSERYNLRCNGASATYPIYDDKGLQIGKLECYSSDLSRLLSALNNGEDVGMFSVEQETI